MMKLACTAIALNKNRVFKLKKKSYTMDRSRIVSVLGI
jgi:hypothetical protein